MTIQSVRVLANGWTIEVEGAWPASTISSFQFFDVPETVAGIAEYDETTARILLTVTAPGHNRSGSVASPADRSYQVIAHDAYQPFTMWPTNPSTAGPVGGTYGPWPHSRPSNRPLGEVDLGGGKRRIRLMLQKPIPPGATFTVQFKAGWRSGLSAETVSGSKCINNSTTAIEVPSVRWITAPYQGIRDATVRQIAVTAAHILPEGKLGVAGVRFVATDGTNKVTAWANMGWANAEGDNVRAWVADMDFTGLNAGPVVVHWSAFPWIGPARHSSGSLDPATATASDLLPTDTDWAVVGVDLRAENPLIFGYDPNGTYYGYTTIGGTYHKYACIVVDPAGGVTSNPTTRAAAEPLFGFGSTPDAARTAALAIPVTGRAATTTVAQFAIRRLERSLPNAQVAGRGRAARSNAGDGIEVFMVDGTHVVGTGTAAGSTSVGDIWVTMRGNGIAACTLQSRPSGGGSANMAYASRLRIRDMTIRLDSGPFEAGTTRIHWHNCDMGRLSGSTAASWFTSSAATNQAHGSLYNCTLQEGPNYTGANNSFLVARSCLFRSNLGAAVTVNCETLGTTFHTGSLTLPTIGSGAAECHFDIHRWNNRIFGFNQAAAAIAVPAPVVGGRPQTRRFVVVNTLVECVGVANDYPMIVIGEGGSPIDVIGCVFEGITIAGNRVNFLYSETDVSTFEQCQNVDHRHNYRSNRVANNAFDNHVCKGDTYPSPTADSLRAAALPAEPSTNRAYLSQAMLEHQPRFGHLYECNVFNILGGGAGGESFRHENRGIRCIVPPTPDPGSNSNFMAYQDNRDRLHTNLGFGDYRPSSTSPLRNVARTAQIDVGADGVLRTGSTWHAGALAGGAAALPVHSQPASARHLTRSGEGVIGFIAPVAFVGAAAGLIRVGGASAALQFITAAAPAMARWRRWRVRRESRRRVPEGD